MDRVSIPARELQGKKLSIERCDSSAWQCNATLHISDIKHFPMFSLETSELSVLSGPLKQNLRRWWFRNKKEVEITVSGCKRKSLDCDRIFNHISRSVWMCWETVLKYNDIVTSNINQQMHLYTFHLKHFKTHKTTPICFDLFRSSSGSFVVPC